MIAIRGNNTLPSLNLRDNFLRADGAKVIADAIKDNKSIISLDCGELAS